MHSFVGTLFTTGCPACYPKTPMATNNRGHEDKKKWTLLSRVVVAVVAFWCPLFLYQNAAVLCLNVDIANFCTKEIWDQLCWDVGEPCCERGHPEMLGADREVTMRRLELEMGLCGVNS